VGFSDDLADAYTGRGVNLLRFDAGERAKILAILRMLEEDLVSKLMAIDPSAPLRAKYRKERLDRLLSEVRATIKSAYRDNAASLAAGLRGLAGAEASWATLTINGAVGVEVIDSILTEEFLRAIASDALIQGAPSAEWWKRQGERLTNRFMDEIRTGMSAGESIDDMVRRIRGKATGRRHKYIDPITGKERWYVEFAGGIMDTGTRQARALVRTSVQQVAADARRAMYQANDDVIKGVQQISTLDGRTTETCIAYSGAAWDLDGKPIRGNSLPFNGGVPRHYNCRSTEIPLLKSWRDLGIDMDELPQTTRSSMDGQVAADLSFGDWLSGKPESMQDHMLGKGKAQLWRDGVISLTDLVDQTGNPLTLAELKEAA